MNITAGMDMSIGEFEAVGEVVKAFTSENATVVVGTVIDPEMSDEMRVTVVATGLGQRESESSGIVGVHHLKILENTKQDGTLDYHHLERPTVIRNQVKATVDVTDAKDIDYLDIPAFLRRQEDE